MGAGVSASLMTYLFGDTFNEFIGVTEELIEFVPPEMYCEMFEKFEHNIDKMVKNYYILELESSFLFLLRNLCGI